jgi:hypothetical protein
VPAVASDAMILNDHLNEDPLRDFPFAQALRLQEHSI